MIATLLKGVVLPAAAATVVLIAAWRPWRRQSSCVVGAWAFALAIAICMLLAFGVLETWAPWTRPARWYGLLPLALTAAALGVLVHWLPTRWLTTLCVCAVLGASGAVWIDLPGVGGMVERTGLGMAILVLAMVTAPATRRVHSIALALALAVAFATFSVLLWHTHFAKLSLIAGSMTAACALAAVVAAVGDRSSLGFGAALTCGALIPAFALTGYAYDCDTVPLASWGLTVVAVPAVWVTQHPWIKRRTAWQSCAIGVVAVAMPCVVALALAGARQRGASEEAYPDYGAYGSTEYVPSANGG